MRGPGRPLALSALAVAGSALLAATFLVSASAAAQGLGAVAAKERDRRDKTPAPQAKVFTNDDLPARADGGSSAPPGAEAEGGEADAGGEAAETASPSAAPQPVDPLREELDREREKRVLAEREWRTRFAEARARVREAEARCWQEVVRTEFYRGIPVQMKVKEFVETEEYRQTKRDLADLQEEFRRTGHPPGWARE